MITYRVKTGGNRDYKITLTFEERPVNNEGIQEEIRSVLKTKAIKNLKQGLK